MTSSQRFALAIAAALVAFGAGCKSGSMSPNPEPPPDTIALPTAGYIATFAGNGLAGFNGDGKASLSSWLYWPVDAYGLTGVPTASPVGVALMNAIGGPCPGWGRLSRRRPGRPLSARGCNQ